MKSKNMWNKEMELDLVNQKTDEDCTLACISMVTGVPLSYIKFENKDIETPVCQKDAMKLLVRYEKLPILRASFDGLNTDSIFLLTVPSLNFNGVHHSVVAIVSDKMMAVYDPQKGRDGKKYYEADTIKSWADPIEIIDAY